MSEHTYSPVPGKPLLSQHVEANCAACLRAALLQAAERLGDVEQKLVRLSSQVGPHVDGDECAPCSVYGASLGVEELREALRRAADNSQLRQPVTEERKP